MIKRTILAVGHRYEPIMVAKMGAINSCDQGLSIALIFRASGVQLFPCEVCLTRGKRPKNKRVPRRRTAIMVHATDLLVLYIIREALILSLQLFPVGFRLKSQIGGPPLNLELEVNP